TPLLVASRYGHEAVARLLLDKGADVSAADKDRSTPLLLASERGHEAVTQLVLQIHAFVCVSDEEIGRMQLRHAKTCGQEVLARLLLDKSSNDSEPNIYWQTPLHIASEFDRNAIDCLGINRSSVGHECARVVLAIPEHIRGCSSECILYGNLNSGRM
ncbi:ankyrin, partial [Wilcoxina mikolae CBS 423.85]